MLILQARAQARALLFEAGEFGSLDEALQPLFDYALDSGIADEIGADAMFTIVHQAFAKVLMRQPKADDYNAEDDFARSIDLAYEAIRERMAAGGKGWEPPS